MHSIFWNVNTRISFVARTVFLHGINPFSPVNNCKLTYDLSFLKLDPSQSANSSAVFSNSFNGRYFSNLCCGPSYNAFSLWKLSFFDDFAAQKKIGGVEIAIMMFSTEQNDGMRAVEFAPRRRQQKESELCIEFRNDSLGANGKICDIEAIVIRCYRQLICLVLPYLLRKATRLLRSNWCKRFLSHPLHFVKPKTGCSVALWERQMKYRGFI